MTNSKLSFLVQRWGVSVSARLMNEQKNHDWSGSGWLALHLIWFRLRRSRVPNLAELELWNRQSGTTGSRSFT